MKRAGRIVLFGLVAVVTVVGLAYAGIGLWGRRQWDAAKKELLARGEPLSLTELIPAEIPDAENFYATPSWRALARADEQLRAGEIDHEEFQKRNPFTIKSFTNETGEKILLTTAGQRGGNLLGSDRLTDLQGFADVYRKNHLSAKEEQNAAKAVLQGLASISPLLAELNEAAKRPGGRFPYQIDVRKSFETPLPHISPPIFLGQILSLRAAARMATGDSAGAAEDILLTLRLGEALEGDLFMISKLSSLSCAGMAIQAFWECTVLGTWQEEDLAKIQAAFASLQPGKDIGDGLRAERGALNEWLSQTSRKELVRILQLSKSESLSIWEKMPPALVIRFYPWGLVLADQAFLNRTTQQVIDALENKDLKAALELREGVRPTRSPWGHLLSQVWLPSFESFIDKAFTVQSQLDLAILACALERYKLRHGAFPASLEVLVPELLPALPLDPFSGKAIAYELRAPDNYRLTCKVIKSRFGDTFVWNRRPEAPSPP